jgi:hypothetical protein
MNPEVLVMESGQYGDDFTLQSYDPGHHLPGARCRDRGRRRSA